MQIVLNGESRSVEAGSTLRSLVLLSGAHPDAVAVALNGAVVPRRQHPGTVLSEGDRVEVIRAVGGG